MSSGPGHGGLFRSRPGLLGTPGLDTLLGVNEMAHILVPENPSQECERLLGRARHCRDLVHASDDKRFNEDLAVLAACYEAKASLVLEGRVVR